MRDKLAIIAAIDRLCRYPIPLSQKIRMISYDNARLKKILKIAAAYEKTHGAPLPNHGRARVAVKAHRRRVA